MSFLKQLSKLLDLAFILMINWLGYNMCLSTAQDIKGANFDGVKFVLFDEFIIDERNEKILLI